VFLFTVFAVGFFPLACEEPLERGGKGRDDDTEYGGWEEMQKDVVTDLCNRIPEVMDNGVIGISWMAYQDSQDQHNLVYGQAEYHKGLIDSSGNKKPNVWDLWNTCGGGVMAAPAF